MEIKIKNGTVQGCRDNREKQDKPNDSFTLEVLENGRKDRSVVKVTFPGQPQDELLSGDRVSLDAVVRVSLISGLCYMQAEQFTITKLDGKRGGEK